MWPIKDCSDNSHAPKADDYLIAIALALVVQFEDKDSDYYPKDAGKWNVGDF